MRVWVQNILHIAQTFKIHTANRVDWVLPDSVPQNLWLPQSESTGCTRKCNWNIKRYIEMYL